MPSIPLGPRAASLDAAEASAPGAETGPSPVARTRRGQRQPVGTPSSQPDAAATGESVETTATSKQETSARDVAQVAPATASPPRRRRDPLTVTAAAVVDPDASPKSVEPFPAVDAEPINDTKGGRPRREGRGAARANSAGQPSAAAPPVDGEASKLSDGAIESEWGVAPASDADLAAIALATGASLGSGARIDEVPAQPVAPFPDDEEMVTWTPSADEAGEGVGETPDSTDEQSAARRRRRRSRGRRGGAGRNGTPTLAEDAASEQAGSQQRRPVSSQGITTEEDPPIVHQPVLPAYPVEFEPMPPPTKRRPARRPGVISDPRFSREQQAEIDQFVRSEPPSGSPTPTLEPNALRASLLTAEEERELAQAVPARRRSRRGRGGKDTTGAAAKSELEATPAFAPMPAATARADQSPVEALLARQNVILDTLMERQISLLRNIERSLIALDQRLSRSSAGTSVPRMGVFVDVPNVIYAAERIGCNIDFGKLLSLLTAGRELVRASAYAPVSDDPQMRLETQKFVQPFVSRGYRIVTKPLKRFADGTMKGNFDVELAMDILTMADRLDVVCLVSGDGDFSRLVEMIASKGVRVEVVAFSASTSSELRATCDEYIDLGTRLREICS